MKTIVYRGFSYAWTHEAFLNESHVAYALEQLWRLAAGSAPWDGPAALVFGAITLPEVEQMLNAAPGEMPWTLAQSMGVKRLACSSVKKAVRK